MDIVLSAAVSVICACVAAILSYVTSEDSVSSAVIGICAGVMCWVIWLVQDIASRCYCCCIAP